MKYTRTRLIIAVILVIIIVAVAILVGLAFGLKGKYSAISRFSQVGKSSNRRLLTSASPQSLHPSKSATAYAQVDSLKFYVGGLQLSYDSGGGNIQDNYVKLNELEVTVGSGVDSVNIDTSLDLSSVGRGPHLFEANPPPLSFKNAIPIVSASYKVKAFCRTANYFMYTSTSGVQLLPLASTPVSMDTLVDYDYIEIDNWYKPNAQDNYPSHGTPNAKCPLQSAFSGDTPDSHCGAYVYANNQPFTVASKTDSYITFFMNPTWTIACDDNTNVNNTNNNGGYELFTGNQFDGNVHRYREPSFGFRSMFDLSAKVIVSSTPTANPIAQSYAVTFNSSILSDASVSGWDWGYVTIVTVIYDSTGTEITDFFMLGQQTNCQGVNCFDILPHGGTYVAYDPTTQITAVNKVPINNQYYGGGSSAIDFTYISSSNTYNISMGTEYWIGMTQHKIRDRMLVGFTKLSSTDYTTILQVDVKDGPDCGSVAMGCADGGYQCGSSQMVNLARGCMGSGLSETYYMMQLPR